MSQNKKILIKKALCKALNETKVPSVSSVAKKIGQEFKIIKIFGKQVNIYNKDKKINLVCTIQDTTTKTNFKVYLQQRYMDILEETKEKIFREFDLEITENQFTDIYFHVTGFNTISSKKSFPVLEFTFEKLTKNQKSKLLKKSTNDGEESDNEHMSENEDDLGNV